MVCLNCVSFHYMDKSVSLCRTACLPFCMVLSSAVQSGYEALSFFMVDQKGGTNYHNQGQVTIQDQDDAGGCYS